MERQNVLLANSQLSAPLAAFCDNLVNLFKFCILSLLPFLISVLNFVVS